MFMDQQQLFVKMALLSWDSAFKSTNKTLQNLSDEQLMKEVAPGRNTGIYLVGHLVAIHDNMFPLLDLGQRTYESLDQAFISNPDKSGFEMPAPQKLREYWNHVHERLRGELVQLGPAQWFEKHTLVSDDAFEREPHRNKLNVLLSRTSHMAYHGGQLALIK